VTAQATRYKDAITLQMVELCSTVSNGLTGGHEWGGAWSKGCALWKEYPEIAEQLQVSALQHMCTFHVTVYLVTSFQLCCAVALQYRHECNAAAYNSEYYALCSYVPHLQCSTSAPRSYQLY
jgi:predicted choloylglycine hydrolase